MYCLVQQMRKKGQRISLCKEELEKKATLSKQLSQTEANSVFEIVSRYEESPAGFEHFCADIFRQLGYKAEVTPPANDGGYDILLSRDGETAIMECKCYAANHKIGRPALQKLVGANSSMRASQMWFVTTSSFSAPAAAYGKEQGIQYDRWKVGFWNSSSAAMGRRKSGWMPVPCHSPAPIFARISRLTSPFEWTAANLHIIQSSRDLETHIEGEDNLKGGKYMSEKRNGSARFTDYARLPGLVLQPGDSGCHGRAHDQMRKALRVNEKATSAAESTAR